MYIMLNLLVNFKFLIFNFNVKALDLKNSLMI